MSRELCGSTRIIDFEVVQCERQFNHSTMLKHRAFLEDLSEVFWDGDTSEHIQPRSTE